MITKVKGCPFCGGYPEFNLHFQTKLFDIQHRCSVAGQISLPRQFSSLDDASKHWNTRRGPKC